MKRILIRGAAAFVIMALLPLLSVGRPDIDGNEADTAEVIGYTDGADAAAVAESSAGADSKNETKKASGNDGIPAPEASAKAENTSGSDDKTSTDGTDSGAEGESTDEKQSADTETAEKDSDETKITASDTREKEDGGSIGEGFCILDTSTGRTMTVDEREFCCGALGYEMAPLYEKEALKAQCVACYTHFCRLREKQRAKPDKELNGADFKADLSKNEYYLTDEAMRKKWGDYYQRSRENIDTAVDECFGEVLCDDKGALIDAAYFALSSGQTENAKDIFGFDSPYLRAVPSPFDLNAPDQISEVTVSAEELCAALKSIDKDFALPDNKDGRISEPDRTSSGSVIRLSIGGHEFTGAQIRTAFGLRSANFDAADNGDSFVFTVHGYGHGVGMSQYGANVLAKQGSDYKEILRHYYGDAAVSAYRGIG